MSKLQCSTNVYHRGGWLSRCANRAVVQRDGKFYCKRHDPVAVAEKQVAKETAYDTNRKAAMDLGCDKRATQDLLVRKAAAFDQIMAVCKVGSGPTLCFLADLLQEFEEATHE